MFNKKLTHPFLAFCEGGDEGEANADNKIRWDMKLFESVA